jgi:uncharacterized membrane protein YidH (DUF202 family)
VSIDLGDAPYRTTLAWRRSGMAVVVTGLAVDKGVASQPGDPLIGAVVVAMGMALWAIGGWAAHRRSRDVLSERPAVTTTELAPLAIATFLFAAVSIGLVLTQG